jgi:hypothetical protein
MNLWLSLADVDVSFSDLIGLLAEKIVQRREFANFAYLIIYDSLNGTKRSWLFMWLFINILNVVLNYNGCGFASAALINNRYSSVFMVDCKKNCWISFANYHSASWDKNQ